MILLFRIFALATLPSNSVIYGVVPPFFGDQPLKSVTQRLPELKHLGVDVIWLSPLQESDDPGAINYSVTNYFKLRPDFGTDEDLKDLVQQAHLLGLKVIIDFVPNHTSILHPYFVDAESKGPASPYYDFYDRDSNGQYTHYFDWDYLPNLNYSNPRVAEEMLSAFCHWIKTYDIDGFRFDVAWGIRERAPFFWPETIKKLKAQKPELLVLAEAAANDPYYFNSGFDLAYDWGHELGHWAWEDVFQNATGLGSRLDVALQGSRELASHTLRFLNNNDTGNRFITKYGVNRYKVASILEFTVPGTALLYSGDEVGAQYEPYADPPPIDWRTDSYGLQNFFQNLIKIRKTFSAFSSDDWYPLKAEGDGAYVFLRGKEESQVMVVLNFSGAKQISILMDETILSKNLLKNHLLTDAVSSQTVPFEIKDQHILINAPAETGLILYSY